MWIRSNNLVLDKKNLASFLKARSFNPVTYREFQSTIILCGLSGIMYFFGGGASKISKCNRISILVMRCVKYQLKTKVSKVSTEDKGIQSIN
jgi:hypothetical protein